MSARNANSNLANTRVATELYVSGSIFHITPFISDETAGKTKCNNKHTCSTRAMTCSGHGDDLQWSWYVVMNHSFRLNFW